MAKTKMETIEEWKSKGAEWLATKLWDARANCQKLREDNYRYSRRARYGEFADDELRKANNQLERVMRKEGITPHRLIVTFKDSVCQNDEDCNPDCFEDGCLGCNFLRESACVETFSFYTWEIAGKQLTGITRGLEDKCLEVIEVVDEKTMTVLYEANETDA